MSFEHAIQRIMSGESTGVFPTLGRAALAVLEPVYRLGVTVRNRQFDRKPSRIRRLPKPVVSVGNLTTGGTGKTPVIRWLASRLRERGLGVGIISRGYKAAPGTLGDEQRMLLALLGGGRAAGPPIVIESNPDRHAAGLRALAREPAIDVFLLDDGFQHRRLYRELDIVLLHAAEPFGYGRVLPRGLLREPVSGLKRAGAVILTNADAADDLHLLATVADVRQWNADCPVVQERHEPTGLRSPAVSSSEPPDVPLAELGAKSAFCFSGLGSPGGFERQVRGLAGRYAGQHQFPDHHKYTADEVRRLRQQAEQYGADVLVTTEKDWVKLAELPEAASGMPQIWRLDVEARFSPADEATILTTVMHAIGRQPRA